LKPLYLFVWEGVLPDYTDGIAFALAENRAQAKALLIADGVPKDHWKGTVLDGVKSTKHSRPAAYHLRGGG
jgi:hypothetical protein